MLELSEMDKENMINPLEEYLKIKWSELAQIKGPSGYLDENQIQDSFVERLLNYELEMDYSTEESSDSDSVSEQSSNQSLYVNENILKTISTFPTSQLNAKEQEVFFSIIYGNMGRKLAQDQIFYQKFTPIVLNEQKQFQNFARERNGKKKIIIPEPIKKYIDKALKHRYLRVEKYPQFYISTDKPIPIFYAEENPPLKMELVQQLGAYGLIPSIHLPNLNKRVIITKTLKTAELRFPSDCDNNKHNTNNCNNLFKRPVSQDPNAIYFATNYQADIVISSSAINCLIENLTDPYLEWEIPITIKSIQERYSFKKQRMVFVDKPWPAKKMSHLKQMKWFYKFATKDLILNKNHPNSINFKIPKCSCQSNYVTDDEESDPFLIDCKCQDKLTPPGHQDNLSYNLWKISRMENKFIKHQDGISELKILVRNRLDGHLNNKFMTVRPKIEFQPEMGCELLSNQELHHIWSNLFFKPNSSLINVRINAENQEVIATNTIHLHELNFKTAPLIGILFSILSELHSQPEGKYLLRHTEGSFCQLYVASEHSGKDLHEIFSKGIEKENFPKSGPIPFLNLDPFCLTNYHRKFSRIPLTFPPKIKSENNTKRIYPKRKNKNKK